MRTLVGALLALSVAIQPLSSQPAPFHLIEATIDSVRAALASKHITCRALVEHYVKRIEAYDKSGPALNAVQTVNRRALQDAERPLFYLAIPPAVFDPVVSGLSGSGLAARGRVVVEKPFGHDLPSSHELDERLTGAFAPESIFRIDHYLGKAPVQNLLALRFGNTLMEAVWHHRWIASVDILVAETAGVDGREGYYAKYGALRDMVQNHMLQLLCLVAMEQPASDDANALRDEKLKVLRSLKAIVNGDVAKNTVRGQYKGVKSESTSVASYQDELPDDKKGSRTETFVALKAEIENWRWSGVPIFVRTGKCLPITQTELRLVFQRPPVMAFHAARSREPEPMQLVVKLDPAARRAAGGFGAAAGRAAGAHPGLAAPSRLSDGIRLIASSPSPLLQRSHRRLLP